MQTRSREAIDGDFDENYVHFSDHQFGQNQHEINCSMCFETFYTDEATFDNLCKAIEEGIENPFLCGDCQEEYEELAHSGH
ncbi:hypothetical protein BH10ACI3_BH10ACI3_13990 [soil metagenome]